MERLAHDAALERTAAVDEQPDAQGIGQRLPAPCLEPLVELHEERHDLLGVEIRQELAEGFCAEALDDAAPLALMRSIVAARDEFQERIFALAADDGLQWG